MTNLLYGAVLHWVNQQRERNGIGAPLKDLPKGIPDRCCECVIARAFSAPFLTPTTDPEGTLLIDPSMPHDQMVYIEHPALVREFIEGFDLRLYPDLIDETETA